MAMEKQKKLVNLVSKMTSYGDADWKETVNDDVFQLSLAKNSIRISLVNNHDTGSDDIQIELLNSDGHVVDTFTDVELDDGDQSHNWFKNLKELYSTARRVARGSEKVLNDLISELENHVPF